MSAIMLHVGGEERRSGWTNMNIMPGPTVDIVGDGSDLSQFADGSCRVVYASHVMEHMEVVEANRFLSEAWRVLQPGGELYISVPDMDKLAGWLPKVADAPSVNLLMNVIYGGRLHEFDAHRFGYNKKLLSAMLATAGFEKLRQVERFGIFDDTSGHTINGHLFSLNVIAYR